MKNKYEKYFPENHFSEMKVIRNGKIMTPKDDDELLKIAGRWKPFDSVLIGIPGNHRFLPILSVLKFSKVAHDSALKRGATTIFIAGISLIIAIFFAFFGEKPKMWLVAQIMISLFSFLMVDFFLVTKNITALSERESYIFFLRKYSVKDVIFCCLFMLTIGMVQLVFQRNQDDLDYCLLTYGLVFKSISVREYWRFATGAFIHASAIHWFSNFIGVVAVGAIVGGISRKDGVFIFFFGCVSGNIASWLMSDFTHAEACQGISAGIFGILGFCIVQSRRMPSIFPMFFSYTLSSFAILNLYIVFISNPMASNESHIVGLVVGMIFGSFRLRRSQ